MQTHHIVELAAYMAQQGAFTSYLLQDWRLHNHWEDKNMRKRRAAKLLLLGG